MNWRVMVPVAVAVCVLVAGCKRKEPQVASDPVPIVVTADIQAGIEKYIEDQVRLGGGHFKLPFGDRELRLNLVKVHTEYLANLGPRSHFACVDLVDVSGDVYDVDFFLSGDPGAMKVTETTVHKINGQPYYAWEQKKDGSWHRIPVEKASEGHFGVIKGQDQFEFLYRATLPEITSSARMWLPLATTDPFQTVEVKSIAAPGKQNVLDDREHGNKVLFLELGPNDSGKSVEILYQVQRLEKGSYPEQNPDHEKYLKPERLVPSGENFKAIAEQVVEGKKGDLVRARALYDHVIDRMRYIKHGSGWGKGDAVYACDVGTGNCTDFHSYFIALAREVDIPARFAIGASIPSARNEGGGGRLSLLGGVLCRWQVVAGGHKRG